MHESARLFYALWPDDATRVHLQRLQVPVVGRKLRPENLHMTLAFLGLQSKSLLPMLTTLLDRLPVQGFMLAIDRYGYFSEPRIAWAGPSESPPLLALQQSLMRALRQAQVPIRHEGTFTPHVTLARDAIRVDQPIVPGRWWHVGRIVLAQSIQLQGGVIYSPIAEKMLA